MVVSFEVSRVIITLLPQQILVCTIIEKLHIGNKQLMSLGVVCFVSCHLLKIIEVLKMATKRHNYGCIYK